MRFSSRSKDPMAIKKKPVQMKILKTQTRDKINTPQLPKGMPEPPDFLTPPQLKYYFEYAHQFHSMKILTQVDAQSVANLSVMTELRDVLQNDIKENGATYVSNGRNGEQKKINPSVAELGKVINSLRLLMAEFGLTPSSRTKIQTDEGQQTQLFGNMQLASVSP
jgi:P27 family predicted phage terminase small subunit